MLPADVAAVAAGRRGRRRGASPGRRARYADGAAAGTDPWLPRPVLAVLVRMLDQWLGRHLLVPGQVRRPDLDGFGLGPCGEDHRFVLEHLLAGVERCARQRAKRRQRAPLDAREGPEQPPVGCQPDMTD